MVEDGYTILNTRYADSTVAGLRSLPALEILRQVWNQNFVIIDGHVTLITPISSPTLKQRTHASFRPRAQYEALLAGRKREQTEHYKARLRKLFEEKQLGYIN